MFSGIIDRLGVIHEKAPALHASHSVRVLIATGYADLELGESVAVNGVCLTVAELAPEAGVAAFFVSPETLRLTQLGAVEQNHAVNLERAVTLNTRLSGHLVQGHVDGLAEVISLERDDAAFQVKLKIPHSLARYCVAKGSIAINGVSLTLNSVVDSKEYAILSLQLIPHTWIHTTFQHLKAGDAVNVEVDVVAKYVERLTCRNSNSL